MTMYSASGEKLTGLIPEIMRARTLIQNTARELGFEQLRISGYRHAKSTSVNPGHLIDITFKLR